MLDAQMRAKQQASEADLRLADTNGAWCRLEASLAADAANGESHQRGYSVRADPASPDAALVADHGPCLS